MKKCYWVSTEITFGPSYKVLLLCDSCHQNMMINMIGTVLAKAATCFRFLLKSGQNKNIDFVQIFDNGKTWPKLPILYCTVNDSFHLLEFFLILEFIFFWNSRSLLSNDAFELLEFWFFSGSGNSYCSSLPMIYFLEKIIENAINFQRCREVLLSALISCSAILMILIIASEYVTSSRIPGQCVNIWKSESSPLLGIVYSE